MASQNRSMQVSSGEVGGGSEEPEMAKEPGHSQVRGPEPEHRSLLLVVNIMKDLPKPHRCCYVSTVQTALTDTAVLA